MWLIIDRKRMTVFGVQFNKPGDGLLDMGRFEVKEWYGPAPPCHNPDEGVESYDPTVGLATDHELRLGEIEALRTRVGALEQKLDIQRS